MSDRVDRLMEKRKRTKQIADERESKPSKPSQPEQPEDEGEEKKDRKSVKKEYSGTFIYLPEAQKRELGTRYNFSRATYESAYDETFEKNRHFYPLVVQYGLEDLEDMEATEIRDRLEELGLLDE